MLNAGFQYLEQRDANDTITKDGVVGKNSPFATSDNSGIYDIIAEDLRWLKENVDDVKDLSELEAIKQSVIDMYNEMKNDSSFGEATAKAQAEEAKKQAQAALESATNAKTYRDDVVTKSTEANETLAEIKEYIGKAEKLVDSNKELEQSFSDYLTMASNKAKVASDSATNAATSEANAAASEAAAKASETNAKTSETNAAESAARAEAALENLGTHEANAAASEAAAKTYETNAAASEAAAKTSESSVKQYYINSSNSADLSKAWAESSESPDSVTDADSTTGKTQSSKSWALYAKARAISAYSSEKNTTANEENAKTSATNAKVSETNAATSAANAKQYESDAKDHMDAAATSETHAAASATNAKTYETNAAASEAAAKASEINSRTSSVNATNSAELAKAWAESIESPDTMNDTDSTTGKTQSSKTWALYSRDRAISAYSSESNAKASESSAKNSETNAKTSETNAKASETAAKTSETKAKASETNAAASEAAAKASETNASASRSNAATSETNAKSYMDTTKGYMDKTQEAYESAQAIQSIVDTAKANAEKCVADVEAVKESLSKIMTYQGSVDNYSDLPTNPQVGYSYNVKNADKTHGVNAGDNLVWNGTDWDNLGGSVDMSLFAELGKDVKFNTVTATTFTGNLKGNADTATKATQDDNGKVIADTYLKKSGGTMTGEIVFSDPDTATIGINSSPDIGFTTAIGFDETSISIMTGEGGVHFFPGGCTIDRDGYHGNVDGTATKAKQDASGNVITNTYVQHCIDIGSVDLDTIKTGGLYTASNSENATEERHYPEPAHDGSLLVVGNEHGCTQTYTTYSDLNCYIRRYDADVGTWSPWMGLPYVSDLDDKQDKLIFDTTPTANSTNPVTSDGVKKYVDSALALLVSADDKSY